MAAKLGNGKTWPANVVLCFFLLSVHMNEGQDTVNNGQEATSSQKLEVDKLLRKLNKPAVKSIKSPDGDVIDCVSILKQPAFDHPKLKNHKIKMRSTFRPEVKIESKMSSKSKPIVQPWHQVGSCPNRTIPIRRTRKEDILRASSIQQFGKNLKTVPLRSYVAGEGSHEVYPQLYGDNATSLFTYWTGDSYKTPDVMTFFVLGLFNLTLE
ncbi:uncharacterized protein LOC114758389 [Neltuma alba]|uniref:uncharacterized protein LOC114758389 n=1 Tax=Neltuma alba TaxID=207710 RepID=UPI0010A3AFE1|nr:uncharacterized protein LOC114758389 [Prosopis alba]